MNKMYIYLFKEKTGVGYFARFLLKYPYTHIALTFDAENYITFSRRQHYNPFNSGFMIEENKHYTFGKHQEIEARYYEVDVTEESIQKINDYIQEVSGDCFNLYGMILSPFGGIEVPGANNCMSFVAKALELNNMKLIKHPYYKNNIQAIEQALIQAGCPKHDIVIHKEEEDEEYMKKIPLTKQVSSFFKLNKQLIHNFKNKKHH